MKRWLLILLAVVVSLGGLIALAVFFLVDAAAIRQLIVERASQSLGRKVELGELGIVLLPQPAVRLESLRVAGDAGAPDLVTADSIALQIALLPLFSGSVELAAVELARPAIRLPVDAEGMPVMPDLSPRSAAGASPTREQQPTPTPDSTSDSPDATGGSGGIRLAIDRLVLTEGSFEAGDWKLSDLQVSGELDLTGESRFEASADLPGLGQLRDIQVSLRDLMGPAAKVQAQLALQDFALEALGKRLALVPEPLEALSGTLSGTIQAALTGSELGAASGELEIAAARVAASGARVEGPIPIRFELGGPLAIDLTGSEVRFEESFRKPAGERLRVDGTLGRELGPQVLREVRIGIGPNDVPVRLALNEQRLEVAPCKVELAPIAPWVDLGGKSLAGTVEVAQPLQVRLDPLRVNGKLQLDKVRVPLEKGDASLSGPVLAQGSRVRFDQLSATIGEQVAKLDGAYDLEAGRMEMDLGIAKADVDALVTAATGSSQFAGILGADLSLRGPPTLEGIQGSGSFSISPGELRGFSLLRQVLGPLGQVAEQVLRARGKDLSRYEEETFEQLLGNVRLADGVVQVERLQLVYRYGSAELSGKVSLVGDQRVDLAGSITLPPEVASDVLGTETKDPFVLRNVPIRGTLDQPRVQLDSALVAQLVGKFAARKAVGDKLDEKLKERLGSQEEVDAVKGLLEGVLGGRKRDREQQR